MLIPGKMQEKRKTSLRWMDDVVADLKVMKIKLWMEKTKERESNGDWLLGRPRLTQGCSAERMEAGRFSKETIRTLEFAARCVWLSLLRK
jgi:hypothetical protein